MEYWSDGFRINPGFKINSNSEFRSSIIPLLHYSGYPLTYAFNAARQSRIGGKPNRSDNKQRKGV